MADVAPLPGFVPASAVPSETISRHRGSVPDDVLALWSTHGYGTAVDGFIKVIDPDHYREQLDTCLPSEKHIPIFATGLADVIVWTGSFFTMLKYRYGTTSVLTKKYSLLRRFLSDTEILSELLSWGDFPQAVDMRGPLGYTESFGYVPILALGGREEPASLQKVDLITHIQLITELAGPIRY